MEKDREVPQTDMRNNNENVTFMLFALVTAIIVIVLIGILCTLKY